jgi:hypothetical protein
MWSYSGYHGTFNVTKVPFHEKRRMVLKLKNAGVLNEKTKGGTKKYGILKEDQRL